MQNPRRTAILVAVLFIIATAASVLGQEMAAPLLAAPDYLSVIAKNADTMVLSVLFYFIACAAIAGIPIALYPIFRRHSEALALSYLGARFFEALVFFIGGLFTLGLLALARNYATSEIPDAAHFLTLGAVLSETAETAYVFGTMVIFSLSAVIVSVIFYASKLVPRWLSLWKFVGALMLLAQGLLVLFDAATPTLQATLFLPIAVNEMVLALWLIFKGFDDDALATLAAKP